MANSEHIEEITVTFAQYSLQRVSEYFLQCALTNLDNSQSHVGEHHAPTSDARDPAPVGQIEMNSHTTFMTIEHPPHIACPMSVPNYVCSMQPFEYAKHYSV